MIARDFEEALHRGFVAAREAGHNLVGVEHVLLALLDQAPAAEYLQVRDIDVQLLRAELFAQLDTLDPSAPHEFPETQPTKSFQYTIQRAILEVTQGKRTEVNSLDYLKILIASPDDWANEPILSRISRTR